MAKTMILSCPSIRKELEEVISETNFDGEVHFLSEKLHATPPVMHTTLQGYIDNNKEAEKIIICVSGCGKSTVGLKATTADLILPRTMDCIDILLTGTGIKRPQGSIFITQSWMNFFKAGSICHEKLIAERGYDAAAEFLRKIYHGFEDFYIIDTGTYDTKDVEAYITPLVKILNGRLHYLPGKFQVLRKMLSGNYDKDVIVIPKGGELSIHEFDGLRPAVIKK